MCRELSLGFLGSPPRVSGQTRAYMTMKEKQRRKSISTETSLREKKIPRKKKMINISKRKELS